MKRCPTCNRTYTDDGLSFCLDDGQLLVSAGGQQQPPGFDPNATLAYPAARDTSGPPAPVYPTNPPPQQVVPTPIPTPSWGPPPTPQLQQQGKKSHPLAWILGIVGVLLVLGIGSVVIFSLVGGSNSNNSNSNNNNRSANNSNNSNRAANANNTNANNSNNSNYTSSSADSLVDDFSEEKWPTGTNAFGSYYDDDEYHMSHSVAGQYIVIYGPDKSEYYTANATVRVTARSIDGKSPESGYGLVVHGEMKNGQLEDYAFIIVNGEFGAYSVVQHQGGKETILSKWARTSAVRTGTTPNQLEVRIKGSQLAFYVNGQYITSITDTTGYNTGRVGFYTSNGGEVAFDDLEITRQANASDTMNTMNHN